MSNKTDFLTGRKRLEAFPLMEMLIKHGLDNNATNAGSKTPDTLQR